MIRKALIVASTLVAAGLAIQPLTASDLDTTEDAPSQIASISPFENVPNEVLAGSSTFVPLSPARVLDTRTGVGGVATTKVGDGAGGGAALEFVIAGKGGLPAAADIGAVSLNVTAVGVETGDVGGYLTVYPCGTRPNASNLNFFNGQTVPNAVVTPVSSDGKVCFYVYGKTHIIADVNGYMPAGGGFTSLSPDRLFDTRTGVGGVATTKVGDGAGNGAALEFDVSGKGGLPTSSSSIGAVSLNVTVVNSQAPNEGGYVTVYPCGTRPTVSNLNFVNGQTVPNAVITPIGPNGKVCFYVYGKADVIADVNGYFGTTGFSPVTPARIMDTRDGSGGVARAKIGDGAGGGTALSFTVIGKGNVPTSGVSAVTLNVTVVSGEAPAVGGYVTVYPCGTRPTVSSLNFVNGQTVPNAVVAPLSNNGKVCFYVYGKAHLIADVSGYFPIG